MIKSMTGFGRGEYLEEGLRIVVEIKSVNNRYNDINIRMPRSLNALEERVRKQIAATLSRGKIDVFINWQETDASSKVISINSELAIRYYTALRQLSEQTGASFNVGTHQIAMYPEVMQTEYCAPDETETWRKLGEALQNALENIDAMRLQEGKHIADDMLSRIRLLSEHITTLEIQAPRIATEYQERLLLRMRDALSKNGFVVDEMRILQEAAIYAERTNFTEELVRLQSHVQQFQKTLQTNGAIGKKMDFLVQEINRETNTVASKCNDYSTAAIVVEMKSEIEKIREQVQNVE